MEISFLNDHRKSFFSILLLIFLVIISAGLSFKYIERFTSVSYYGKTLSATTEPAAEGAISKAMSLYVNDLYLRTYSQVYILKLSAAVKAAGASISDADKAALQDSLNQAISGAQLATTYDSKNYLNFQSLAKVYEQAGSLGVKDGYRQAVNEYTVASTLNPFNPGIKLSIAGALFADKQVKEAKDYANAALSLKPDYVDAYIVLSQIARSQGDNANALQYAIQALALAPTDANLQQYVDALKKEPSTAVAPTTPAAISPKTTKAKK